METDKNFKSGKKLKLSNLHSFSYSIKNIFYDKMDLRLFYFHVKIHFHFLFLFLFSYAYIYYYTCMLLWNRIASLFAFIEFPEKTLVVTMCDKIPFGLCICNHKTSWKDFCSNFKGISYNLGRYNATILCSRIPLGSALVDRLIIWNLGNFQCIVSLKTVNFIEMA